MTMLKVPASQPAGLVSSRKISSIPWTCVDLVL